MLTVVVLWPKFEDAEEALYSFDCTEQFSPIQFVHLVDNFCSVPWYDIQFEMFLSMEASLSVFAVFFLAPSNRWLV